MILRGVSAAGPEDVFIVGDHSTLLHWAGGTLRRLDTSALGRQGALAAVVAPRADRPGFVVGPSGLWRIVRVP